MTRSRTRVRHATLAALLTALALPAFLVVTGGAASSDPAPTPTPSGTSTATPTPTPTSGPITVDDAALAWGVNDESNTKAFAPGTYNFLSAGAVPDPGEGGQTIVSPGTWRGTRTTAWRARAGHATLQKQQPDGTWRRATFAGLSTTVAGDPIPSTGGPFSGHRIVLDGGTGTVDPAAGTATIAWSAAFSIVYYSGYTFVTVTNPRLVVTPTAAVLRATLAGYAANRADPDVWSAVPARSVVLADLPRDAFTLPDTGGFTVTPDYRGVTYGSSGSGQVRSGDDWGSFPTSFVSYLDRLGSGAFWYSSGGEADPHKLPQPLAVSYAAAAPVDQPDPGTSASPGTPAATVTVTASPQPTTSVNPAPPAPAVTVTVRGPVAVVTAPAAPTNLTAPPVDVVPTATTATPISGTAPQPVYALTASPAAADPPPTAAAGTDADWRWWLGSLLLAAALGVVLLTVRPTLGRTRS